MLLAQQALRDELSNVLANNRCCCCLENGSIRRDTVQIQAAELNSHSVFSGGSCEQDGANDEDPRKDTLDALAPKFSDVPAATGSVQLETAASSSLTALFVHSNTSRRSRARVNMKVPSRWSAPATLSASPNESTQVISALEAVSEMQDAAPLQHYGDTESSLNTWDNASANSHCEGDFVVVVPGKGTGDKQVNFNDDGEHSVKQKKTPIAAAVKEKPSTPRQGTQAAKAQAQPTAPDTSDSFLAAHSQASTAAGSNWRTSVSVKVAVNTVNEKGPLRPLKQRQMTSRLPTTGA
jgi:hypothetical protein